MTSVKMQLFASMGFDLAKKRDIELDKKWSSHNFDLNFATNDIRVIFIERGPKNIAEIKNALKSVNTCVILFAERNTLLLKTSGHSYSIVLESNEEYERISSILATCNIAIATNVTQMKARIRDAINKIPNDTSDFDNRGLFSTHYLRNRIFNDARSDIDVDKIKIELDSTELLNALGWKNSAGIYKTENISIIITDQTDFSTRQNDADIAPSYIAVAELKQSQWVILTNGKKWRLYTSKVSATSTNYFEITLVPKDIVIKYLIIIFGIDSYKKKDGKTDIELFYEESKKHAKKLEENLSERIMSTDGLFLNIVKGILDHDLTKTFKMDQLDTAKQSALKIMYRIWFLAYAESRDLLPTKDTKYKPISLQSIREQLDSYDVTSDNTNCWSALLKLFEGMRKGSPKHNLPQYSGNLFKLSSIDNLSIKNYYIVKALHGLLEKDGESMDYSSLSVRHLGNIFESLMEYSVRQTEKDIMLIEDKNGVREVKTKQESTYSYKKNDLYLASKGGIALRKTSASFYTPDKIVEFLVSRGLEPIFKEREKHIGDDLKSYQKNKNDENLQTCMDRLLDIQVLDPSMGSGHFLVEVLNRITFWATNILKTYPEHPLLEEIESDRKIIFSEQDKNGIIINKNLLTYDVLLKRKIMKRCIFGVDINPLAVDLAKLSLWLDSFAIGVPLTYMDHHIKVGDSTIGMFLDDLKNKEIHTLDDWAPGAESNKMICDVISSSDITVEQAQASEERYREYKKSLEHTRRILDALTASKINPKILPKKGKDEFIHRFGRFTKTESDEFIQTRRIVNDLAERHHFFHWELEMMDAFTDSRHGFDLLIGNPPWDKVKPSDDEFFTPFDVNFRSMKPKTEKKKRVNQILKDSNIKKQYDTYKKHYREKNAFYDIYKIQSMGDRELSKLVLERILNLVTNDGIICMVLPSQLLSNKGAIDIRKNILEKKILSLYVFENRKKIFPIHSSYRFGLFSIQNSSGSDEFPAGFYLHNVESLFNNDKEKTKFGILSKRTIQKLFPTEYIIPEIVGEKLKIYEKISKNDKLGSKSGDGWNMALSRGFDKANDSNLLSDDNREWPVFEGKNIHQYDHKWSSPEFYADESKGLNKESKTRIFTNKHVDYYNSYKLVFRDVARSTDVRTVITSIIPPQTFYTHSLRSLVFKYENKIILDLNYNKKILYFSGIFNSLTFDFLARTNIQVHLATIIKSLPMPKPYHEDRITKLAVKLVVGTPEFEALAESIHTPNVKLTPAQRIEITAEIDALVADSYALTYDEYATIIDSFNLFKKNPNLYIQDEIVWNNRNLKEFYGEMADLALQYFEIFTENKK